MESSGKLSRPGSVAQYWRSIDLLTRMGVPTTKLATLFQTSEANIRQIGSRVYEDQMPMPSPVAIRERIAEFKDEGDWDELRRGTSLSANRAQRLLSREQQIEQTFAKYAASQRYLDGAAALRLYLPYVAKASHPEILRLRAMLHQRIAWFYSHAGRSDMSVTFALEAMATAQTAYDESLGDSRYLKEYSESALIAANSLLTAHQPLEALRLLDEADHGNIGRKEPIGSEHFRQRATALFQLGHDDKAEKLYRGAREAGETEASGLSEIDLEIASDRHRFLFEPRGGIDSAGELASKAASHYGVGSLQHMMATNWAAATALWFDSLDDRSRLLNDLQAVKVPAAGFGHQATIAFLLSITPQLDLPLEARRRWIRFLLYENAFRSK